MREYRDDDIKGGGFCPHCGTLLWGVKLSGIAYCEEHGWVFVNFGRMPDNEEEQEKGEEGEE